MPTTKQAAAQARAAALRLKVGDTVEFTGRDFNVARGTIVAFQSYGYKAVVEVAGVKRLVLTIALRGV